ncbi:MAG: ATP-binding protein [Treponema sp.]|jgi:predicted AAA+ superfamily ATPase|nr:ATP-binding protein [Treponema sp.]
MKLSEIREIAKTQKEELNGRDSGHERELLAGLPDIQSHALIVSGIRRCGKSTLLHQYVKRRGRPFFYLNFDDMRLTGFANADYGLLDASISESGAELLFFDEVQTADRWELYVRQKLDESFQVILTGSNASLLSWELGSRLTGRHISKELFPFSYREYCDFAGMSPGPESLDVYLEQGGFPEYLKTGNQDIIAQLQSDILYRDIAVRYRIRNVSSLTRLFVYMLSNPAQQVSPSRLRTVAGVKSPTTVLEYFSDFEAAWLISLVPCFSWSVKTSESAPKKLYIADPGMIRTGSAAFSGNLGALLENFVFNSLRMRTADIYYFSGKGGGECDFIVNSHGKLPACIQVCRELSRDNEDREIRGLLEALEFFGVNEGLVLTRDTEDLINQKGKNIRVLPAWKYFGAPGNE